MGVKPSNPLYKYMTDTSLPSHQPSVSPQSYVDSYAPPVSSPAMQAQSTSTPVSQQPSPVPTPSQSPAMKTDPLAELEKALDEYEAKQKKLTAKTNAIIQRAEEVKKQSSQEDPLAELERVLDEYEARYKTESVAEPVGETQVSQATPADVPTATAPVSQPVNSLHSDSGLAEPIEEQNIFELLGVTDAEEAEKEAFLDELQQALWDDFLDKDLQLLVDAKQLVEMNEIKGRAGLSEVQRQEELIKKVEEWVPDVEEIMLEKALQLKEDMVRERVQGMKEYFKDRSAEITKIQEAEKYIQEGRWKTAAGVLNALVG